jgi:hypothetical protein
VKIEPLMRGPGRSTRPVDLGASAALVAGGLLVVWTSYIHFHLWVETNGYRSIPTIGPLFLLQSIADVLLGLLIIALRRVVTAALGIGFALATMVGFLISVEHGLFGFKDSWSAPFAHQAFAIEIATVVVLLFAGVLILAGSAPASRTGTAPTSPTAGA